MESKANVLLIGAGGVGTVAALNLEVGGLATVTAVLRSNFDAVKQSGFQIQSRDHGQVDNFMPSRSELSRPCTTMKRQQQMPTSL